MTQRPSKTKLTCLLCFLALVVLNSFHQAHAYTATVIPQTAFDTTTTNVVWENTNTGYPADDDQQQVAIGFSFPFGGTSYNQVRIISNGLLHFGADQAIHQIYNNRALPIGSADRMILPYFDDLDPAIGGSVSYGTLGSAPNRRFVVTWSGIPRYNLPATSHMLPGRALRKWQLPVSLW